MPSTSADKINALQSKIAKAKATIKEKRAQIAAWQDQIDNLENAEIATKVRKVGVPVPEICSLLDELAKKAPVSGSTDDDGSDDL